MTIYEEMQALKDSVDKLHKKLEELKQEMYSDNILGNKELTDFITRECEEHMTEMEYKDEETILLLSVLVNKVDELSEHTMISLRERQLMDSINKRANQIRTARKKKRWR